MLGKFERGQTVDLAVVFVSNVTGELIDPTDPTVEISHYEGTTEIIDLAETVLTKIATRPVGHYTYEFVIPVSFILDEMYFVRWRGEDPNGIPGNRDIVEEQFVVVASGSVSGSGDCCCLVPRFTTC
jgi:hypothetical protein